MNKTRISELIPHAGSMVLLDEVLDYDESSIRAYSSTGEFQHHPLSINGTLAATALIEYSAQAVALHVVLTGEFSEVREGRLASVKEIRLYCTYLEEHQNITIEANKIHANQQSCMYSFAVSSETRRLAEGQLLIVLAKS